MCWVPRHKMQRINVNKTKISKPKTGSMYNSGQIMETTNHTFQDLDFHELNRDPSFHDFVSTSRKTPLWYPHEHLQERLTNLTSEWTYYPP